MSSTIALITARLKSTRLPRKALIPIRGRTLIDRLTDRLEKMKELDGICLCTSTLVEDTPLLDWASNRGIPSFTGDPVDVLDRLMKASEQRNADTLFCVTGDNPLVSPPHGDALLSFHRRGNFDYSRVEGLPIGTYGYAVKVSALKKVCASKLDQDTEIWGGYFTESGKFRCGTLSYPIRKFNGRELRLTVDTPEDLAFIEQIAQGAMGDLSLLNLEDIYLWAQDQDVDRFPNIHVNQQSPPQPRFRT